MGPRGPDEEPVPGAACCGTGGGIWDPFAACTVGDISSTLRHFDSKVPREVKIGPLIPCERRLPEMEIPEFQELTSETRFGNRDYGRPFGHF